MASEPTPSLSSLTITDSPNNNFCSIPGGVPSELHV